jgi:hypothetical protein
VTSRECWKEYDMENQVFRDPAYGRFFDNYRVLFNDRVCSPDFNSKGAAAAYLSLLEKGRKPEYAEPTR